MPTQEQLCDARHKPIENFMNEWNRRLWQLLIGVILIGIMSAVSLILDFRPSGPVRSVVHAADLRVLPPAP